MMTKEIHDINTRALDFVVELIEYIFEYPDDDYMTMECLCRKLVKHGLLDKADGYYQTHEIRTNTHECIKDTHDKTEPLPKAINGINIADAVAWADKWLEDNSVSEMWDMIRTLRDATEWQTEPLDKDINVRSKDEPQIKGSKRLLKGKDEPQTCEECEHWSDTEDGCADRHGCKDEPQAEEWYTYQDEQEYNDRWGKE